MKAYGLPRTKDLINPDVADIHQYGLKSSTGKFAKQNGDFNGYCDSQEKQTSRRRFKRIERANAKKDIRKNLEDRTFN